MGYFGAGFIAPGHFAPGYFPGDPAPPADSFFEVDLLAFLAQAIGVTVYPGHIPRKAALPALSFFVVGGDHLQKLSGRAGQATARVQVTVSSKSYLEVGRLGLSLEGALDGFRGRMGGTKVNSCIGGLQITRYDPSVDASDRGVHEKIQEFTIAYAESPNP